MTNDSAQVPAPDKAAICMAKPAVDQLPYSADLVISKHDNGAMSDDALISINAVMGVAVPSPLSLDPARTPAGSTATTGAWSGGGCRLRIPG